MSSNLMFPPKKSPLGPGGLRAPPHFSTGSWFAGSEAGVSDSGWLRHEAVPKGKVSAGPYHQLAPPEAWGLPSLDAAIGQRLRLKGESMGPIGGVFHLLGLPLVAKPAASLWWPSRLLASFFSCCGSRFN